MCRPRHLFFLRFSSSVIRRARRQSLRFRRVPTYTERTRVSSLRDGAYRFFLRWLRLADWKDPYIASWLLCYNSMANERRASRKLVTANVYLYIYRFVQSAIIFRFLFALFIWIIFAGLINYPSVSLDRNSDLSFLLTLTDLTAARSCALPSARTREFFVDAALSPLPLTLTTSPPPRHYEKALQQQRQQQPRPPLPAAAARHTGQRALGRRAVATTTLSELRTACSRGLML